MIGNHPALLILAAGLLILAGCTAPLTADNASLNATPPAGPAPVIPHDTLNQPGAQSAYIVMDTDIYAPGDVVSFTVTNRGSAPLTCAGNPPSFSVKFQGNNGIWATQMGPAEPDRAEMSRLDAGISTKVYRFDTTGWNPGRYRIVQDCGIVREILLRPVSGTTPGPLPSPTPCTAINGTTTTPVITIDPIGDQHEYESFTISGTTTVPAGQDLYYAIMPVQSATPFGSGPGDLFTTRVEAGSCGTNTWSATGEIQTAGDYFIGIMDTNRTATAIKRFTVKPA